MDQPLNAQPRPVADASERLFEEARPGIFKIESEAGYGTGWLLDDQTVATDYHVIRGARQITAIGQDGKRYRLGAQVVMDVEHDLAILTFVDQKPEYARPIARGRSSSLRPADPVYSLGHPRGGNLTRYTGQFHQRATWKDWLELEVQFPLMEGYRQRMQYHLNTLSADLLNRELLVHALNVTHGCSGGPIMDADGRVVSIVSRGTGASPSLEFGIPVERLNELVQSAHTAERYERRAGYREPGIVSYFKTMEHDPVLFGINTVGLLSASFGMMPLLEYSKDPMCLVSRRSALTRPWLGAAVLGFVSYNDADGLIRSSNWLDSSKYGVALTSDAVIAGGYAAKYLNVLRSTGAERLGRIGKGLMVAGVAARVATELIPNNFVVDIGNKRNPGE